MTRQFMLLIFFAGLSVGALCTYFVSVVTTHEVKPVIRIGAPPPVPNCVQAMSRVVPVLPPKRAVATLLTDDNYLLGATVLLHALWRAPMGTSGRGRTTPFPVVALVTTGVSATGRSYLRSIGYLVTQVSSISTPQHLLRDGFGRYSDTYTKLHIFNQTAFSEIVFYDADVLPLVSPAAPLAFTTTSLSDASARPPAASSEPTAAPAGDPSAATARRGGGLFGATDPQTVAAAITAGAAMSPCTSTLQATGVASERAGGSTAAPRDATASQHATQPSRRLRGSGPNANTDGRQLPPPAPVSARSGGGRDGVAVVERHTSFAHGMAATAAARMVALGRLPPARYDTGIVTTVAAAADCCDLFNPGVLVVRPDAQLFQWMLDSKDLYPSYDGGDGGFLNSVFDGQRNTVARAGMVVVRLPTRVNVDQSALALSRYRIALPLAEVGSVHYAGVKPWDPIAFPTVGERKRDVDGGEGAGVNSSGDAASERKKEAAEVTAGSGMAMVHNLWRSMCEEAWNSIPSMARNSRLLKIPNGCPPLYDV